MGILSILFVILCVASSIKCRSKRQHSIHFDGSNDDSLKDINEDQLDIDNIPQHPTFYHYPHGPDNFSLPHLTSGANAVVHKFAHNNTHLNNSPWILDKTPSDDDDDDQVSKSFTSINETCQMIFFYSFAS